MGKFTAMSRDSTRFEGRLVTIFVDCAPTYVTQSVWDLATLYDAAFPQLHVYVQRRDSGLWCVGNENQPAQMVSSITLEGAVANCRKAVAEKLRQKLAAMQRAMQLDSEAFVEHTRWLEEYRQRCGDVPAQIDALEKLLRLAQSP